MRPPCPPVLASRATTASTWSWVAPGVITTITVNGTVLRLHSVRARTHPRTMIVRVRLFCSDPRCAAAFEAIGPIEELETLACSCGGGLEIIGLPDEGGRAGRRRIGAFSVGGVS